MEHPSIKDIRNLLKIYVTDDVITNKLMAAIASEIFGASIDSDLRNAWCELCTHYINNGVIV